MIENHTIQKNKNFIVIGSGPGGMTFAISAAAKGANVTVIEQAGDPRGDDSGYTNKSFNLTINNVGRKILGEHLLAGCTPVYGRAIHNFKDSGSTKFSTKVDDTKDEDILMSVSRPILRRNMVEYAERVGVKIMFNSRATAVEPNDGRVTVRSSGDVIDLVADLVVISDGLHSLADKLVGSKYNTNLHLKLDPLKYVTVKLEAGAVEESSLSYIHFWHNADKSSVAIGLPNQDNTVSVLLVSDFNDCKVEESPFPDKEATIQRLIKEFPDIYRIDNEIYRQLIGRPQGRLFHKSIPNNIVGDKCIVVGDASCAFPPWAGFGANTAIYSADALVRYIYGNNENILTSLSEYEEHADMLTKYVREFAKAHGEFLNKDVASKPDSRPIGPVLGKIVNKTIDETEVPDGVELLEI
jgi:flavin-dependent dehydrogenase